MVHNYYKLYGGEDKVVFNEKSVLEKHGHKVLMYTRNNSEMDGANAFSKIQMLLSSFFSLKTYRDIKRIIQRNSIDVVHVHNTLNLISPSVYYAGASCGVPVVQTVHNFRLICPGAVLCHDGKICEKCVKGNLLHGIFNQCYRNSFVQTFASSVILIIHRLIGIYGEINYIALTDFNKQKLLNLKQIKPEKVFIKPNFSDDVIGSTLDYGTKNGYIFAGRLDKIKGINILLEAWEYLGDKAPKLTICGCGEMEEMCHSYVKDKHINNITFAGQLSHDRLNEILRCSKALIFPSIWYEGLPMTIIESFVLETPVIVGNIGNGGSIVKDGVNGIKYEYDKPEALARAVLRMEKLDTTEYQYLCVGARKEYEEKYTEESNYQELINIYYQVQNN